MTKQQQADRDEYRDKLRALLAPGDTLYTVLRHRAPSGMSRAVDVYRITNDEPMRLTYWIGKAADFSYSERWEALTVQGCGMDVGFEVVYNTGRALWPDGFECAGDRCQSNDHTNGDRNYSPHHHSDGGYALRHRWI